MFDIIELNETGTEEIKLEKAETTPSSSTGTTTRILTSTVSTRPKEILQTTAASHSQLPEQVASAESVTMKQINSSVKNEKILANLSFQSIKKMFSDKDLHKEKTINDLSTKEDDKLFSKEVEMLPDLQNSLIKLNRTNRKELPIRQELNDDKERLEDLNKSKLVKEEFIPNRDQHIEIKIRGTDDVNSTSIFITTRKPDQINETSKAFESAAPKLIAKKPYVELPEDTSTQNNNFLIDPKIENLNVNAPENNESELFVPAPSKYPERLQQSPEKSVLITEQPQQKSSEETPIGKKITQSATEDPVFHPQKKPNRKRQLTKAPSRSFYPYFFSRVLG